MRALLAMLGALLAAPVAAQPAPLPPPLPGPVLALPVLEADFRAKAGSDTILFERNSYVLSPQAQGILDRQALWLATRPWLRASIEGHADTRQTRDYALALGERRAAAVRNHLLARGVLPHQLSTVSWGRERPAVEAAHEATWLQNSRVVTVLKQ